MANEARKKGLIYRVGYVFGRLSAGYRRLEAPVLRWGMKKGMPATLVSMLSGLVRLGLIGVFLCLVLGVLVGFFTIILCKEILLNGSEINEEEELVWMDGEQLFPDPYSPENINDPAFHKFD